MDDHSDYCECSPVIKLPTREDLLHPQSHITHEEITKYRAMQGFIPHEATKYSQLEKTKNRDFECAEAALAYYNKIHYANYKLIEATKSHSFFCGWVWYHCVFRAAPETSSAPELFFAELHRLGSNRFHVITIAPVVIDSGSSFYCQYCVGKRIPHPVMTLSRDPHLLQSEGMNYSGSPSLKKHYEESLKALESLEKTYEAYCPEAHYYSPKLSSGMELYEEAPRIKKLCTGFELNRASDLNPIFRTSDNKVGLFHYKDKANQKREQETTWEDELIGVHGPLGLGRQQEVLESEEKSYVVNSQVHCNLQQSTSQFLKVREKDVIKNFSDASKHQDVMTHSSYVKLLESFLYDEDEMQEREQWEAELTAQYNQLGLGRQQEVHVIDGDKTPIRDTEQTIATDAARSHSPILPLVDVTSMAGHVKKIGTIESNVPAADNVHNKENIPARRVRRKLQKVCSCIFSPDLN